MQLEMAGWMADFGFKLIFNLENIVTTSIFRIFSYNHSLSALAIVTQTRAG